MIVEVATFQLAAGITAEEFLERDAAYQAELMVNNAGFVRRTVARKNDEWLVVSLWWSEDEAERATADTSDLSTAFRQGIDTGSFAVARYETLD